MVSIRRSMTIENPYAKLKMLIANLTQYLQSLQLPADDGAHCCVIPSLRPLTPPSVQIDLDSLNTPPGHFLPRKEHNCHLPFKSIARTKRDKRKVGNANIIVNQMIKGCYMCETYRYLNFNG